MTTIAKFYLLDAATPNTGTMPTGAFINGNDADGDAAGARTARDATDVAGTSNPDIESTITAIANTSAQKQGHRRFVSRPLAAHTFAAADGNWTFSYAAGQSNSSHNGSFHIDIYLWRPSTGLQVGTAQSGMTVSLTATAETAYSATAAFSATQAILDGDIIVFEVDDGFTQGMATAYTSTFAYNGTTEASTTTCASFVTPPAALTLYTGATVMPVGQHIYVPVHS